MAKGVEANIDFMFGKLNVDLTDDREILLTRIEKLHEHNSWQKTSAVSTDIINIIEVKTVNNEETDDEIPEAADSTEITGPAKRLHRTVDIYKAGDIELLADKVPESLRLKTSPLYHFEFQT